MFKLLRHFISSEQISYREALWSLRLIFVTIFFGQFVFAGLVGLVILLLASRQTGSSPIVAQILVFLSLFELPLALFVAYFATRTGGKGGAIAGVIALGVILSTPAWFAVFTYLTGGATNYLTILALMLMFYYALGFVISGGYARMALQAKKENGGE